MVAVVPALVATLSVPERGPTAVGRKFTSTAHEAPGSRKGPQRLAGAVRLRGALFSPTVVMPEVVTQRPGGRGNRRARRARG